MTAFSAIIFGLLVGAVIIFIGLFYQQAGFRVRNRLQAQDPPGSPRPREEKEKGFLPPALIKKFEEKLGLKKDNAKVKELRKNLIRAGIYRERALPFFYAIKIGLALALPVLALPFLLTQDMSRTMMILAFYIFMVSGYFLPTFVLRRLVEKRQKKIKEALPDALDLMVVCVEAGQGLNAALKRVADDFKFTSPPLAREFQLVNLEINAGLERELALRNLAERTGVEELTSLCNILIQSDRFGTSMGQALKVQSETLRTTRRQKLEEMAAKTPVKLVFPLLLFIFPALMVVIIGPAAIRIMENFK
ncbi:MAG: type II secretion system F family protein [Thermodesulfobacteriota bacterium]